MPTLDDIVADVRAILSESTAGFWLDDEIESAAVDGIRWIQTWAPNDALRALLKRASAEQLWSSPFLAFPDDMLRPIRLLIAESDGAYGYPWDFVDGDYLASVRRDEGNLAMTATTTRLWSMTAVDETPQFELYPNPTLGSAYRLYYLKTAAESGTLDLPTADPDLIRLVKCWTIEKMAGKASMLDLEMVKMHIAEKAEMQAIIMQTYVNRYGLTPARRS